MADSPSRLFVFAAPSGAGKTTLVHAMVQHYPDLRFSVSYTTRLPRSNETDGVNYFFVSRDEFEKLRAAGELLEWATVFDNLYGTSREQVEKILGDGHNVLLEIDWQGARQVSESMPKCVTVFILPPSLTELERRLRDRRTDSEAIIARRLRDAISDMQRWDEFDYVIINDRLDRAVADLDAVFAGRGDAQSVDNAALRARIVAILGL
ncbi:MAG: guanylate kinase [Proteobacteria bacterium]|nr:guanylate kinase [Pseudomonadota bacterium]